MKNNATIHITIQNGEQTIKLSLPPRADLLDRCLKTLNKPTYLKEKRNNQEEYDDSRYPVGLSKELMRNKKFRKEFNLATEEFADWYFQQYKLSNLIEISPREQKLSIKQNLNKKKWDKLFPSIFCEVIKKNVELLIIHISSNISSDEKAKITDDLSQSFFHIPIKKYYSDRNSNSTLVEVFFFGSDMEKYTFDEY